MQHQHLAGNNEGSYPPQQTRCEVRQEPHPQDQQRNKHSQQIPPHPPPPRPPPPQQYGHDQVKYSQQQTFPPSQPSYPGAQLGAQENVQPIQQPPLYQPPTLPQVQLQPVTTTAPSQSFEAQIDQQIRYHQQKLHELEQLKQKLLLTQQYELLMQAQQQEEEERKKLDQLLTFRRKLHLSPQTDQQQQSGSQQKQSEQPPTPQQHHQKQYDNRQPVSEQPEQHSYQPTVHAARHTSPVALDQPMNTNTQQTNIHGTHHEATHDSQQDVMYEATQGTPHGSQWSTAKQIAATTQLAQEQIPSLGQHKVPSETLVQDVQAQMEHELTIQDHQATTDTNGNGINVSPSHQPTDRAWQRSSVVSPHEEHMPTDTLKDELKVLEEKKQVKEKLHKLQGQSATVLSQGEALQAQAKQLTEEHFPLEESQELGGQQGGLMQSPISCQQDKEWFNSERSDMTTYGGLECYAESPTVTCKL